MNVKEVGCVKRFCFDTLILIYIISDPKTTKRANNRNSHLVETTSGKYYIYSIFQFIILTLLNQDIIIVLTTFLRSLAVFLSQYIDRCRELIDRLRERNHTVQDERH